MPRGPARDEEPALPVLITLAGALVKGARAFDE
jgi:hypothetical protein